MRVAARSFFLGLGLIGFAACGGGGGDASPAAPKDTAVITSANAPLIAAAVMTASFGSADAASFTGFFDAPAPTASKTDGLEAKTARLVSSQRKAVVAAALVPSSFEPQTTSCTLGGTLTVSGVLANPLAFSANDVLVFEFEACAEPAAEVNGRIVIRITRFGGDPKDGVYSFELRADLVDFAVMADGDTATVKGSTTIRIDASVAGDETTTITAILLRVEQDGASHELADYAATETFDPVTGAWSVDLRGTLTSSAFAGSVTFETIAPFRSDVLDFPSSGELLIHGANGGTVRVSVLDSTFVRLTIDADGDGTVDEIVDKTWAELT